MVAIVSGNSAGLDLTTSSSTIGQRGNLGQAAQGQSGEASYINIANGNLVMQDQDALAVSRGIDVGVVRTYNSQGAFNDDNGDGWMLDSYRNITNLTGTANTAGSTVQRIASDGSTLTYQYDATSGLYKPTAGSGQFDTLSYNGTTQQWTWTQASTQNKEVYSVNGASWRLTSESDSNGNTNTFAYTGNLLSSVTDASGDSVQYTYTGNNLTKESVVQAGGTVLSSTYYAYDGNNRLQQVTVDLTPADNSIADGKVYVTTYSYLGNTNQVSNVLQSDGTSMSLTYVTVNGAQRVASVTDGLGRVTQFSYDTVNNKTTVTDPLGNATVYTYDSAGRLTYVTDPTVTYPTNPIMGGIPPGTTDWADYAYYANGELEWADNGGHTIGYYQYDSNGNVISIQNDDSDLTTATYNSNNDILTRTIYQTSGEPGPVGAPETTRYVYDANNNLRFVIGALGDVTEYRYDSYGQKISTINYPASEYPVSGLTLTQVPTLSAMTAWSAAQTAGLTTRIDYQYNIRGQLTGETSYAHMNSDGTGAADGTQSVLIYTYDVAGNLLTKIDADGNQTSYVYDGLNRLLASTDAASRTVTNQYDDAGHTITQTQMNGRVDTSVFDADGELISSNLGGAALTQYTYDAVGNLVMTTDPTGVKEHYIYAANGKLVSQVDGQGRVTQYAYNAMGNRFETIQRAVALTAAQLADPATFTSSASFATDASDLISYTLYDDVGRIGAVISSAGKLTIYRYDGAGNLVEKKEHTGVLQHGDFYDMPFDPDPEDLPRYGTTTSTYYYYDAENRLIGTAHSDDVSPNVDTGDQDITQYKYDGAGRLIETVRYATPKYVSDANATFASLIPTANPNDQHTYVLYDSENRVTGTIDAEGYLTEQTYDANGNVVATTQYANKVTATITPGISVASVRPAASAQDHVTTNTYDALNRAATTTDNQGTVTQYTYDAAGNLATVATAGGTADAQQINQRYDQFGRVIAVLSGMGSAQLTAGMTQTQIDAVWAQYGTTYTYDAAGRRISMTDPNGNKTLYYYDQAGHLTQTINALGEVKENQYNSLNELTATVQYGTRLSAASLATLSGGVVNTALTTALTSIANTALDSKVVMTYNVNGTLASVADPLGGLTSYTYDASGNVLSTKQTINGTSSVTNTTLVDSAGLNTFVTVDSTGTQPRKTSMQYDAFGRLISVTDPNGTINQTAYDRLGQIVSTTDPSNAKIQQTYDAFGRLLTQTDALGNTTTYQYNEANRSITTTTPDGATFVTTQTREGQTQSVTDGNGNVTTYTYDADGNLIQTTSPTGTTSNQYNAADQLILTTDGNGNKVAYTYDAAGRVLTRTVDPTGLALTTTYQYDAKGEQISVTDPNGKVTTTSYDLKGEVVKTTVDPTGLNLVTSYTYDQRGKMLSVTDPNGIVTQYAYDASGRQISQTFDPTGLNLTRTFTYDIENNAISSTDPSGNVTRYVYDVDNRLVYTIDPAGDVQKNVYDADGRITQAISYATPISLTGLSATPTLTDIASRVTANAAQDAVQYKVFDKEGRVTYTVDGTGAVAHFVYDNNGNLIDSTKYSARINLATWTPGTTPPVVSNPTTDERIRTVYDGGNRPIYTISGTGAVIAYQYDADGNLVDRIAYAGTIPTTTAATSAAVAAAVALIANQTLDINNREVFDAAGRLSYSVNGDGAVIAYQYDSNGNRIDTVAYATTIPTSTAATGAAIAAAVALIADPAHDIHNKTYYDAANRAIYSVNGVGAVTQRVYDKDGNVVKQIAYATPIALGAAPTTVATSAKDRVSAMAYDDADRLVYSVDPMGSVTKTIYNANGDVIQKIAYANPIAAPTSSSAAPTVASISAAVTVNAANDRSMLWTYDAADRVTYSVDSVGDVTFIRYDANGNVISQTAYATPIVLTSLPTPATSASVLALLHTDAANDRTTQYAYDADGQLIYTVDPKGYVTKSTYDSFGNVLSTTRYANAIPAATANTVAAIAAALVPSATTDETTTYVYNAAGNLISTTDELGHTQSSTYDANGNQLTFTDKNGSVWHYSYDAAGHMILETDPAVSVTGVTQNANGNLVAGAATSVSVQTKITYDALGNVIQRTEAFGRPEQRITQYQYDALGRQVKVIYPTVSVYDSTADAVTTNGANGVASRTETTVTPYSQVTYDTLGNAVANRDVAGNYSYKAYDNDGRVLYDVDALGYVTGYTYDSFDDTTSLTRYATAINIAGLGAAAPSAATIAAALAAAPSSANRTITTVFDRLGRAVQVTNPPSYVSNGTTSTTASEVTKNVFNAFGQLIQTSVLADATNNIWATTTNYYDRDGNAVATVDAMGYLTTQSYDAEGNVLSVTQYATALSSWSTTSFGTPTTSVNDRTTTYTYDRWNQKTSQTQVNVQFSDGTTDAVNGTRSRGNVTTTYTYDAVGNQTSVTDALGNTTYTYYDAMGRVTAVAKPNQSLLDPNLGVAMLASPITVYRRDVYGNVVAQIEYSSSLNNVDAGNYNVYADPGDRVSLSKYDADGNVIETTDANGNSQYASYDVEGHVTKQWQGVTGNDGVTHTMFTVYQYDAVGHQINKITPASNVTVDPTGNVLTTVSQATAGVVQSQTEYNAFGEVTRQGTNGAWQVYFNYDNAGHMWRTNNGDGVDKVVLYNLQGQQVSVITSAGSGADASLHLGNGNSLSTVTSAQQAEQMAGIRRTDSHLDLLGRATSITLAARGGVSPVAYQTFDRWGNVLSRSTLNGLGSVITYQYNDNNQVIQETDPDGNGAQSSNSPITKTYYDRLGRQIAVVDANGNLNSKTYDANGNVLQEHHADGGVVQNTYDLFGDQTKTVDAMGNAVNRTFDKLGRLIQTSTAAVGNYSINSSNVLVGSQQSLVTSSHYDEAGRLLWTQDAAGAKTFYTYDLRGNQTSKTMPMGQVEKIAYDNQGKEIADIDADGSVSNWTYDYFGEIQSARDIGGATYTFTYDAARQLVHETSTRGQDLTTHYDGAGEAIEVDDAAINQATLYTYNIAGQHVREQTIQNGVRYQDNWLAYNAQGALARIQSPLDGISVTMTYDKNGNLIHQQNVQDITNPATYTDTVVINGVSQTISHTVLGEAAQTQNFWYGYNNMNEQVLVDGAVDGNVANTANVTSNQGHVVTYDLNGNRTSDTGWGDQLVAQKAADGTISYVEHTGLITQYYTYDAAGRLITTAIGAFDSAWNPLPQSQAVVIDQRYYDADGNVVQQGAGNLMPAAYKTALLAISALASEADTITRTFNANGWLLTERSVEGDGTLRALKDYSAPGSYDAAGNVLTYTNTDATGVSTIVITYAKADNYQQKTVTTTRVETGKPNAVSTVTYAYDVNGHLISATTVASVGATPTIKTYVNDSEGNALQMVDSSTSTTSDALIQGSKTYFTWHAGPAGAQEARIENADESGNSIITVRAGDTLQSLAQSAYGDSKYWYVIANANNISSNLDLQVGNSLLIPDQSTVATNDPAFTPFQDSFWDSVPHAGGGGGGGGCGIFGEIVMVVVAVVVAVVAPEILPALGDAMAAGGVGGFLAGAAVGAMASVASQVVGIAIGAQDGFSWKQVGVSALGGGVGGAFGAPAEGATWVDKAATAVEANVITQGIEVATGLQSGFNWASVAGSAVSGSLSEGKPAEGESDFSKFTSRFVSSAAGSSVSDFIQNGHVDVGTVAVDAFGNALGQSFGDDINRNLRESALENQEDERDAAMAKALGVGGSANPPTTTITLGSTSANSDDGLLSDAYLDQMRQEDLARIKGWSTPEPVVRAQTPLEEYAHSPSSINLGGFDAGMPSYASGASYANNTNVDPGRYNPATGGYIYDSGAETFPVPAYDQGTITQLPPLPDPILEGAKGALGALAQRVMAPISFVNDTLWQLGNIATGGYLAAHDSDAQAALVRQQARGEAIVGSIQNLSINAGKLVVDPFGSFDRAVGAVSNEFGRISTAYNSGDYRTAFNLATGDVIDGALTIAPLVGPAARVMGATAEIGVQGLGAAASDFVASRTGQILDGSIGQGTAELGVVGGQGATTITGSSGVYFFDKEVLPYIDRPDATLGRAGDSHFFMPATDSVVVTDAESAYRYTGGAPSLERAYTTGGDVFGVEFPLDGLSPRLPTAADTTLDHFLPGGNTALKLPNGGGYLVNSTREFVVPGGGTMPSGSTLFKIGADGQRIPIRSW